MKKKFLSSAIAVFVILLNVGCHRQLSNSLYNLFGSEEGREIIRKEKAKIRDIYKIQIPNKHPFKPLRMFSRIKPKIKIKL